MITFGRDDPNRRLATSLCVWSKDAEERNQTGRLRDPAVHFTKETRRCELGYFYC